MIVWFRRDLRLADNPALVAALRMAPEVLPVYVWTPEEEGQFQPGRCSRWWLYRSLLALDQDLQALGSRLLCYRASDSRSLLARLAREAGATAVLFNHLYDPISMVRDNEVKAGLEADGIFCQSFNADILREPWEVLDPAGKPFTCYDTFWTAHCGLGYPPAPPLPLPAFLPAVPADVDSPALADLGIMSPEEMSNVQLEYHWQPGSAGAHRLLEDFVRSGRLKSFDADRAKTDRASTSKLSPHIHYGEISVRHIHYVVKHQELEWAREGEGGTSVQDFLRQLGYREYSRYLSFHFPFTHERSLLEHLRSVPWRFDQRLFKAWRQGRTGYPLVDAAMREVWGTGWMHNRMRVVAASFMVKNLLLPWQWGLKHYWDALLDADLECDALGWQYVAGCMADAHEFGYTIDQHTESKRFDPDGNYVRRWLPVLARLPAKYIHEPWLAPESVLADADVELGVNYPFPVISVEESMAALAAANAVVHQCMHGSSEADAAGTGPFRPATNADPAEAERLFAQNYRNSTLGGDAAAQAAGQDVVEGFGASEDVQSNMVGGDDEPLPCAGQPAKAQRWEGSPSGTATATMAAASTAAVSAAPPLPAQLPRRLEVCQLNDKAATEETVGGASGSAGQQAHQQQEQPRQPAALKGQPLSTRPSGGSGAPGSNGGTGHASFTGVDGGGVPSLSGNHGARAPQAVAAGKRSARPVQQQHGRTEVPGVQGSNDSPAGSGSAMAVQRQQGVGTSADSGQHAQWPPVQEASGDFRSKQHHINDAATASAGLKRQRARSRSPAAAS